MLTTRVIRQILLDHFCNLRNYKYIPSGPARKILHSRSSVASAGLSQVKYLLDGQLQEPNFKVAGYFKCILDGATAGHLELVGTDDHHHTFHELFGNCSFDAYSKQDACETAMQLLTERYGLDKKCMKISYFGGDTVLSLNPDYECLEIWRKLGFQEHALLPRGTASNFWEINKAGVCGTTSQIFYLQPDGTARELWNIIFISHTRDNSGRLSELGLPYAISGMLLETLSTILQNKSTSYETDLYWPIITAIAKNRQPGIPEYSGKFGPNEYLDNAYRKLADYSRAISICLADGHDPSTNTLLMKHIHDAFRMCDYVFKCSTALLEELYLNVAEIFADVYPEIGSRENHIREIISSEECIYRSKRNEYMNCDNNPSEIGKIFMGGIFEFLEEREGKKTNLSNTSNKMNMSKKLPDNMFEAINKAANLLEKDDTIVNKNTKSVKDLITQEMLVGIEESKALNRHYMVHFLACSYLTDNIALSEDIFEVAHIPVMLFACCNGVIKIACRVPKRWLSPSVDATKWLSQVLPTFGSSIEPLKKEQNPKVYASMLGSRVSLINCENLVQRAMREAIAYMKTNLPQHPELPNDKRQSLPKCTISKNS